jgi:hypothetical protein
MQGSPAFASAQNSGGLEFLPDLQHEPDGHSDAAVRAIFNAYNGTEKFFVR